METGNADRHQRIRRDPDRARVAQADPRLVVGRGHEAGDDQLPHAQARARRPLLRAHLRSDEGLGVLLRQVQARPLQGHHLRALRRRGDAPEGAPRAHGPHRPGRAGLAHLVLQGRPEPDRLPARHRPARAREGPLLRRLDRHARSTTRSAQEDLERPRGQGRRPSPSGSTSTATRRSPRSRTGSSGAATTSPKGKERNFDEDDEFWARGLSNWAEEQALPPLEEARDARRRHLRRRSRRQITTEDSKKIRELVRRPAIRDDRRLAPRELESVATAAVQIREALAPLARSSRRRPARRRARSRSTSTASSTALLVGGELARGRRRSSSPGVDDEEPREGARARQGPARATCSSRPSRTRDADEIRELANDLCLRTTGRSQKEDLDAIVQWALKVREMYRGHRVAARGRARGGRRRGAPARARRGSSSGSSSRS